MKLYLRGKTWWVTYGGSSRRRVSTHRSDKREAEEYALRLIAPAMMEQDAEMLEKAVKLRKTASKARAGMLLLGSIFKQGAYCSLHGCKESSAAVAGRYWRRFVDFCKSREVVEVGELTQSLCAEFISGLGERSAQLARIYCRQILRDAGYDAEIFPRIRRRSDVTHREPLSREQISTLLAMADTRGMEFATYIRALLYTGLRMGDCATLSADMYDRRKGTISRTMAKTGRQVEFPLHPALREWFDSHQGGYIFPSLADGYIKRHDVLTLRIRRLFASAGIKGEPGQYCAHCLRTTFASLCAEHGIPMAVIQSWLGHTSPMVTRIYARIEDMKRKREALARFPTLG